MGRAVAYLLVEELGEEALGLERGDVAAVVSPDEDASLDVQQEQRRHRARHGGRRSRPRPPDLDLHAPRAPLPAAGGTHTTTGEGVVSRISPAAPGHDVLAAVRCVVGSEPGRGDRWDRKWTG